VIKAPQRVWLPSELVAHCLDKEPLFAPGEGWSYSDTNFILLAMAIEKKTGKDAYAMITERYLRPLGLAQTEPSTKSSYERLANGHHPSSLIFPAGWSMTDGKLAYLPQFEWAGGGFVTSPRDLAVWVRAVVAGDVLSEKVRARMKESVAARTGRGHEYGYGLMVRPSEIGKSYGHGGFYPGYVTDVQHFPDVGVTVCIQANTDDFAAFKINYQQYCVELAKAASS
jgi:D-alanyl-D-alanine carboxypeptidase